LKPFTLLYTAEAKTRIRHLHPTIKQEIRVALEELKENPWIGKRLQRELTGLFSLRVRNYRILYWINVEKRQIEILTLGPRKTVYDDFLAKQK